VTTETYSVEYCRLGSRTVVEYDDTTVRSPSSAESGHKTNTTDVLQYISSHGNVCGHLASEKKSHGHWVGGGHPSECVFVFIQRMTLGK
jgi:hypothetical protein